MRKCSVVINSHNKMNFLQFMLACLTEQTYPCYEIILVDDASDPAICNVPDWITFVRLEGTPNRSRARNRGIARASGEIILLADDDLLVREDWIASHMQHHQHTDDNLVAGMVRRIDYHGELNFWELPFTAGSRSDEGRIRKRLSGLYPWKVCGSNISATKQKLLQAGLYGEDYEGWGVEDVDISYRLWQAGASYLLEPQAVAWHQNHPPHPQWMEMERRNQWLFAKKNGFWPYGTPPPHYSGPVHGPTRTPAALTSLLARWQQANPFDTETRGSLHLFQAPDGQPFLFDARSGLFFALSELGFSLMYLRSLPAQQAQREVSSIAERFSASEIAECLDESYEALSFLQQNTLPAPIKQRADAPYTLSIHASMECNLACQYCFGASAREQLKQSKMSKVTAQQALNWFTNSLAKAGAQGVISFNLASEPLLSWDLLMLVDDYRKHLEQTQGRSLVLNIVTNGTLLTEEKARRLKERNIRLSTLSVDGPPDIHNTLRCFKSGRGSYQAAIRNLPQALHLFPRLKGAATLTSVHPHPQNIAEHLLELGFSEILIKPVRASDKAPYAIIWETLPAIQQGYEKYVRWLIERLEAGDERILEACMNYHDFYWRFVLRLLMRSQLSYRCHAAYDLVAVGPDGSLYPCDNFVGMEAFKIGDVWSGVNDNREAMFGEKLYVDDKESCHSCWARYLCGGGCYYCAYLVNGDIAQPDPVKCELTRFLIEMAIWFCTTLAERNPEMFTRLAERCQHYNPMDRRIEANS